MPEYPWNPCLLSDLAEIGSGDAIARPLLDGPFVLMGANGPIGTTRAANFGPGFLVGRVGAAGAVNEVLGKCWASDNTLTVVPKAGRADFGFVGHLLRFLRPADLATKNAQPLVTQTNLAALEARVPQEVAEQAKIASVLHTLDTTIRQTKAIIEKLKQVKQGLLHDLLTRGIDANGELRPPQSKAPHLYKDSPLGWIPRDWEAGALSRSIELISGQHIPTDLCNFEGNGVPYFTGPSDFVGAETVVTAYTMRPQVMCEAGDILITVKGSGCGKVAVAGVAACISRQLMAVRVVDRTRGFWLQLLQQLQPAFNRLAEGGNIPGLGRDQILSYPVATPASDSEMSRIAERLASLDARADAELSQLNKLRTTKNGLMDDLLTGRVRVTPLLA